MSERHAGTSTLHRDGLYRVTCACGWRGTPSSSEPWAITEWREHSADARAHEAAVVHAPQAVQAALF